ncbi:hypothetical protein BD289DRAFT_454030 [Coniella lustricola]|uniref:Uncharacterized protein n=1 Tax=Coniella lustricola TaxID=2025994 RepID=A0A2T3A515_9PEZI|nr:hypothetical protein BD289DRAFT_454030 [Coniella lustricola]
MAAPSGQQIGLVLGLLYACGALLEFMIRILFHEMPRNLPEPFYRRTDLIILRPFMFLVLPALMWPFIMIYRVGKPAVDLFRECCLGKEEEDDVESNWGGSTCSQSSGQSASMSSDGSFVDLEKQETTATTTPGPQVFMSAYFSDSMVTLSPESEAQFSVTSRPKSLDEVH